MENEKTPVTQLRDALYNQINKLADPNCDLDKEIKRADSIAKVGTVIVNSYKQEIDLLKIKEYGNTRNSRKGAKEIPLQNADQKQVGNG